MAKKRKLARLKGHPVDTYMFSFFNFFKSIIYRSGVILCQFIGAQGGLIFRFNIFFSSEYKGSDNSL